MTTPLDLPQKYSYLLVQFQHGDPLAPVFASYTDWLGQSDTLAAIVAGGDTTYAPTPTLEVKIADNSGVFENKTTEIVLPAGDAFTTALSNGRPHSPIFVWIREVIIDPLGVQPQQELSLFRGRITRVLRSFQGNAGSIKMQAVSVKENLNVALGMVCNQQCVWSFGGVGCQIALGPLIKPGTLTTINNDRTVVITGLPVAPDTTYWKRGYLTLVGLSIAIREWKQATPTVFTLTDKPPPEWLGAVVQVTPGCDKTIEVCRSRWNNEQHFAGLGYAMPDYHPSLEG